MKKTINRTNLTNTQMNRYLKWFGVGLGIFLLLGLIIYGIILYGGRLIVKEEDLVLNESSRIETSEGKVIHTLYEENREVIDTKKLPNYIKEAFISIEDRRFYDHGGVDLRSISRAVIKDVMAGSKVEGASTITQQVSKNLFLSQDKTFMRKTKEAMASIYLERRYSKDEILDLYLNVVYFGEGAYGLETAAQTYFSKDADDLTIAEVALLAGLVKGPNGYSPIKKPDKAKDRRSLVLKAMEKSNILTAKERLKASRKPLGLNQPEQINEPWLDSYIDYVTKESAKDYNLTIEELKRGGYKIVTNLDEAAQKIAYETFQIDAYFPGNTEGSEGAFVLRESGGKIVALLGGRKYALGDLNRATVKRQTGSTMKPIAVYGPAMMKKTYNPYSMIVDQLKTYDNYTARNYDGQYDNSVSIYEAVVESKNAPAVNLLDTIGLPYAKKYLSKMQIDVKNDGLSLALGGLEEGLTPIQMADAYDTFRNQGTYESGKAIEEIYDEKGKLLKGPKSLKKKVFSKQVSWDMTEILQHTTLEGTARWGNYPKSLAGKTGSTQHPFAKGKTKDAWFIGYTPTYSVSVWMGYDNSDGKHYLNGDSEYPTELAKQFLTEFDKQADIQDQFTKPKGVKDLPKPIKLPVIESAKANYELGGFKLIRGNLSWTVNLPDERVEYYIYRVDAGEDERIGHVKGNTEFTIKNAAIFSREFYYVVPYNPLTKTEGARSELIELSF